MMKKKVVVISVVAIVLALIVASFFGKQGLISLYQNQRKYDTLEKQIVDTRRAIDSLKVEVSRLKNDTAYIERIAREKLGMARKNEKVYRFIEDSKKNQ
jgi:cell division protein FtsL